ncbi:unnamed protein product [Porites lobata]|uniref:Uncharacterized protein n=1 Tax=Porites lobata TaxID=104759 RepID=A0ABN8MVJ7_9CNID|nr:unnamed protein product [Porites lobata]
MKVAAILCLFLLTLVSAPVWGRSVKTKDATELNRSETKDSREKEESNGEISDAQKDAEANKCTCEIPEDDNQQKSRCEEKCDCSKQDTKKCRIDTKSCNCEPGSKKKNIQCQKEKDGLKGVDTNTNATKKCNCQCSERECAKEEDPRSAAVATAAMIVAVTAANLVVAAATVASHVAAAAVTSAAAHAAVTAVIAVHAAAIAAARNRNRPIKCLKRSTH